MKDGVVLVSPAYIAMLVQLANERFVKNRMKSDEFYTILKREILRGIRYPPVEGDGAGDEPCVEEATTVPDPESGVLWTLVCRGNDCEEFRSLLLSAGYLDRARRNAKLADGRIAVPVTSAGAAAIRGSGSGALWDAVSGGRAELAAQEQALPSGRGVGLSRHATLRVAAEKLLEECGQGVDGADGAVWGAVPRHWEEYGDLVLLPEGSFATHPWAAMPPDRLWEAVARGLGAGRVALKAEVDCGPMRQSRVALVHPAGGDGWVDVVQNGLRYTWDVTRVMFSRGNVNERRRMGQVTAPRRRGTARPGVPCSSRPPRREPHPPP
jgi:hypothetical protein